MPLSVSQLLASADTGGDALRLIRAAMNLTQADMVARSDGAIGADQISLIERGKRPMTSKQCTAIARALHLTDADEAQLILLAQIDRAPERLKPILRQARLRITLDPVEAFLRAYPADKMAAFIMTMETWQRCGPMSKRGGHPLRTPRPLAPSPAPHRKEEQTMAYDLLIKNGRVIDGSGMPAFRGDVAVRHGKISAIGKLRDSAARTIDADGLVVAPGFIDNHCHYDAQVTWDPLCTFSCYHGATSVIIGNCSLALAPVRRGREARLAEFLSYVEAIPMEVLSTVNMTWETIGEYMDTLDQRLGVNVGNLIGHSAVRYYVMGDDCQGRAPTPDEIEAMRGIVREGMTAGALGLSVSKNQGHYDPQGVHIPAIWAEEDEMFALADVLSELGVGTIQSGGGRDAEVKNRLMTRLAEACGRQVVYNNLGQSVRQPEAWKQHMALVEETAKAGIRANPLCTPNSNTTRFTMRNTQAFRGIPTWHPLLLASDEDKLRAYSDPAVRRQLHQEVVEWVADLPGANIGRRWYDYIWIGETVLPQNQKWQGKSIREMAEAQGKGIIDGFLDLVVEEHLDTVFLEGASNVDKEAMAQILNSPNAYIGLSDGGAHVQFHGGYGYSTRLLGYWVRQEGIMSLEQAVRRLTFESASTFGIYDRGLLRPGLAADITIFDPDTINPLPEDTVHDFPAGGWRIRELAQGIHYTIVNGQVLLEDGRHTGALPGRVLRNTLYHETATA